MVHSMTAFARLQHQDHLGNINIEVHSVNHRYLEIHIDGADTIPTLEEGIRKQIHQLFKRGKITCKVRCIQQTTQSQTLIINQELAQELCKIATQMMRFLPTPIAPVSPMDILKWPGVIEKQLSDDVSLKECLLTLTHQTLTSLMQERAREGRALKELLLQRLTKLKAALATIAQQAPQILLMQQTRLKTQFIKHRVELDAGRLAQEMILFANKIDIMEEIERIETHVTEFQRTINAGGPIGRHLDFLLQEIFRETNTLGAKSIESNIVHLAVEMKVLIEQMREQIQNIE